ncbi:hypothetical protein [Stigmatella aurantiaca]|uniref:Conserved uncharacterized protein n=1 Tax=Stigmatella aurantiaca (strain DW4/3-1) TaxID=378806 RepID=Q090V1_STIAD|nr:hypothetical protein [Stigmatella aurantiaca]ADO75684.1 conserved uncharacterized protein [Stigmatella aurantiaca DW4/3-1]EAU66268.1 conserved hypothetical protein [Stigmatella aurantiaca DW4/3-1]
MPGSSSLPWFVFSLTLAPELVRERLQGASVPELPTGELAEALDVGLVYDVPSADWGGRVARLVEAPGQRVMGLLRTVPSPAWGPVARLEALLGGATGERPVRVRTASGAVRAARAFSPAEPRNPPPGPVSVAFLVALAQAAEHAGLPSHYVERLQAEAHLVRTVQRAQADRVR